MTTPVFLVRLRRDGPEWAAERPAEEQSRWTEHAAYMDELVRDGRVLLGGPLHDEISVVLVVATDSESAVREILGTDPWSGSHLRVESIDPWTIRLRAPRLTD